MKRMVSTRSDEQNNPPSIKKKKKNVLVCFTLMDFNKIKNEENQGCLGRRRSNNLIDS